MQQLGQLSREAITLAVTASPVPTSSMHPSKTRNITSSEWLTASTCQLMVYISQQLTIACSEHPATHQLTAHPCSQCSAQSRAAHQPAFSQLPHKLRVAHCQLMVYISQQLTIACSKHPATHQLAFSQLRVKLLPANIQPAQSSSPASIQPAHQPAFIRVQLLPTPASSASQSSSPASSESEQSSSVTSAALQPAQQL
jgi:hypothetical protein